MENKDLKVGDLIKASETGNVYYVIAVRNSTVIRVSNITDRSVDTLRIPTRSIEPIPLSEGLLNRIGSIDHFGLGLSFKFKKACVCCFEDEFDFQSKNTKKRIKYLHELQHELWDEGININFKIKDIIDN